MVVHARTSVAPGIRQDKYGFQAQIRVGQRHHTKRFPPGTDIALMQNWRDGVRTTHHIDRRVGRENPKGVRPSPSGFCYIYFIQCRDKIKIGRAMDVADRMRRLQTAQPDRLTLLAAVPGHAVLEPAIHRRFERLHCEGEWFIAHDDLLLFIEHVKSTRNLLTLLWGEDETALENRKIDHALHATRDDSGRVVAVRGRPLT